MTALVGCLAVVVPFGALFFGIGVAWERSRPRAVVIMHRRHAGHLHRAHNPYRRSSHLRLVTPIFDFEADQERSPA